MTYLPDVNVWLALTLGDHDHHSAAAEFLDAADGHDLAFCRVTQLGYLRLITNPQIAGKDTPSTPGAWKLFDDLCHIHQVRLAREPDGIEEAFRELTPLHHTGHHFWTDAYLAAFARAANLTLVSFDRGFKRYKNISLQLLNG